MSEKHSKENHKNIFLLIIMEKQIFFANFAFQSVQMRRRRGAY